MINVNAHWTNQIIEYKGTFDLEGVYKYIIKWLQDRAYEYHEKAFKLKPGPAGNMQEWYMESWKKTHAIFRFWINIHVKVWDMNPVEVEKDGETKTMINGRMRLILIPKIDIDWSGRWSGNKRLLGFLVKYIYFKDIQVYWGDLVYYQTIKLLNELKEVLGMETPAKAFYHYMGENSSG